MNEDKNFMFKSMIGGNSIKKFIYFSIDQTTKVNWVLKIHAIIEQNASVNFRSYIYYAYKVCIVYLYWKCHFIITLKFVKKFPCCTMLLNIPPEIFFFYQCVSCTQSMFRPPKDIIKIILKGPCGDAKCIFLSNI